jgi:hypothetical protein
MVDKMDYEGSMIYDEYPDRASLRHLTTTITRILASEETQKTQQAFDSTRIQSLENLVQVLLCNEIYKRRHGGRRRFVQF